MTDDLERRLAEALQDRADVDRAGVSPSSTRSRYGATGDRESAQEGSPLRPRSSPAWRSRRSPSAFRTQFVATPDPSLPVPTSVPTAARPATARATAGDRGRIRHGTFRLTLSLDAPPARARSIDVQATLTYLGPEASIRRAAGDPGPTSVYFHGRSETVIRRATDDGPFRAAHSRGSRDSRASIGLPGRQ